jgi:gluconolactonase
MESATFRRQTPTEVNQQENSDAAQPLSATLAQMARTVARAIPHCLAIDLMLWPAAFIAAIFSRSTITDGRPNLLPCPLARSTPASTRSLIMLRSSSATAVWQVDGNNADGIVATSDAGILIAQNDKSDVVKLDKNGKTSVAYTGTNTGGSLAVNSKGVLFIVNRGYKESIEQLSPQRKTLANQFNDDPLDCIGGVLNDLTADSKGGVYFTMGGVFYMDPHGKITRYGMNLTTNGIVLSPDEKHLYVTNGPAVAAFDVAKDGLLSNQREFAKLEGGGNGDGSTFDSAGRLYVSSNPGVQVIAPDGKYLGLIPTPRGIISLAFSGPDRKTLYAVARDAVQNKDWILAISTDRIVVDRINVAAPGIDIKSAIEFELGLQSSKDPLRLGELHARRSIVRSIEYLDPKQILVLKKYFIRIRVYANGAVGWVRIACNCPAGRNDYPRRR